jgi:hypothetical protein
MFGVETNQSWVDICDIPYLSIWVNLITTSLFSRTGIMVYFREIIPFYGLTIQGSEIFYPDLCDIPSYMWDDPHGMGTMILQLASWSWQSSLDKATCALDLKPPGLDPFINHTESESATCSPALWNCHSSKHCLAKSHPNSAEEEKQKEVT